MTTRDKLKEILEQYSHQADEWNREPSRADYPNGDEYADKVLALPVEGWKFKCQTYGSAKEYAEVNVCDKCEWKDKCSVMGYRPATIAEVLDGKAVRS